MAYKIIINKKVKKFLSSHELTAKIFYQKIKILRWNNSNRLNTKKLNGEKNKYRLRIGKYRFLYEIIEDKILIFFYDANSRGDIYK